MMRDRSKMIHRCRNCNQLSDGDKRIVLIWWVQVWGLNHDIDSSEAQTRVCLTCASDMCSLIKVPWSLSCQPNMWLMIPRLFSSNSNMIMDDDHWYGFDTLMIMMSTLTIIMTIEWRIRGALAWEACDELRRPLIINWSWWWPLKDEGFWGFGV